MHEKWMEVVLGCHGAAGACSHWWPVAPIYREMRANGFFRDPVFETERPALPPLEHPAVLVFSKTNSFIHKEAIPAAKQVLEQIAAEQGCEHFPERQWRRFQSRRISRISM